MFNTYFTSLIGYLKHWAYILSWSTCSSIIIRDIRHHQILITVHFPLSLNSSFIYFYYTAYLTFFCSSWHTICVDDLFQKLIPFVLHFWPPYWKKRIRNTKRKKDEKKNRASFSGRQRSHFLANEWWQLIVSKKELTALLQLTSLGGVKYVRWAGSMEAGVLGDLTRLLHNQP